MSFFFGFGGCTGLPKVISEMRVQLAGMSQVALTFSSIRGL